MAAALFAGAAFGGGGSRVTILGLRSRRWRPAPPSREAAPAKIYLVPVEASECPTRVDLAPCTNVACGELCEGDGECGTNQELNNCDGVDGVGGDINFGRPRPPPPPAGLPRFIALRFRRPPTPRCCRASRAQVPSPLVVWRALTLVSRNEPLFVEFFVLYFPLSSTAFRVLQEVPKPSLSHWAS